MEKTFFTDYEKIPYQRKVTLAETPKHILQWTDDFQNVLGDGNNFIFNHGIMPLLLNRFALAHCLVLSEGSVELVTRGSVPKVIREPRITSQTAELIEPLVREHLEIKKLENFRTTLLRRSNEIQEELGNPKIAEDDDQVEELQQEWEAKGRLFHETEKKLGKFHDNLEKNVSQLDSQLRKQLKKREYDLIGVGFDDNNTVYVLVIHRIEEKTKKIPVKIKQSLLLEHLLTNKTDPEEIALLKALGVTQQLSQIRTILENLS